MDLTQYVGPLPMWGWLALGGGGLFLYEKHKGGSGTGTGGLFSSIIGSGTGSNTVAAQENSGTNAASDAQASGGNESWANDAIGYLEGQGYTASQAQGAIGTWLSGGAIDPSMATLIDSANQGVGPPPQAVYPTSTLPSLPGVSGTTSTTSAGTQPASGTAPSAYVTQHLSDYTKKGATPVSGGPQDPGGHRAYFRYTVKKGDTIDSISKMFGSGPKQIDSWNNLKGTTKPKVGSTIWV